MKLLPLPGGEPERLNANSPDGIYRRVMEGKEYGRYCQGGGQFYSITTNNRLMEVLYDWAGGRPETQTVGVYRRIE